jgi:hypothetical protein
MVGLFMALLQLQKLCSVESYWKMTMNGEQLGIWKEAGPVWRD